MTAQPSTIALLGGLDLVSPPISVRPGRAIAALNYECGVIGYSRMQGHERFDGHPAPSKATFWRLGFTAGSTAILAGHVVAGATSGAAAIALNDAVPTSGDWGSSDAVGDLILYNLTGEFVSGEDLQVSAATVAVSSGEANENYTTDDAEGASLLRAVEDARRALILALPGSGPTRGIFTLKGETFAIRDNAAGTAAAMHKATASGWAEQTFGHTIDFATSTARFEIGETLTGGTSGATATIERVTKQGGDWSSSGTGYLVLSGLTGTFTAGEVITSASGSATAPATEVSLALPAGGTYQWVTHNFYGAENRIRVYLASGAGRAVEWDGAVLAPIRTGLTDELDKPKFICVVSNHLLLGFDGGAVMISGTGEPLSFEVVAGAGELSLGEDITGMKASHQGAAVITGRNKISYLSGSDSSDFQLNEVSEDSGAVANSLDVIGNPMFLDDQGIRKLTPTKNFGNWNVGKVSQDIEPYIKTQRKAGATTVGALRVRSKDQYRLYFSDGQALSIYLGRKNPECMTFKMPFVPYCLTSGEDGDGNEILFAGDDQGFVYQLDSGKSADGAAIEAYLRLSYLHQGAPMREKRYHRGYLEVDAGATGANLSIAADFAYGHPDRPAASERSFSAPGGGGFWDSLYWNQFIWSSPFQAGAFFELDGIGQNVSLVFMSDAADEEPHTLSSLTLYVSPRKMMR